MEEWRFNFALSQLEHFVLIKGHGKVAQRLVVVQSSLKEEQPFQEEDV